MTAQSGSFFDLARHPMQQDLLNFLVNKWVQLAMGIMLWGTVVSLIMYPRETITCSGASDVCNSEHVGWWRFWDGFVISVSALQHVGFMLATGPDILGPGGFFRSSSNLIDFFIVVFAATTYVFDFHGLIALRALMLGRGHIVPFSVLFPTITSVLAAVARSKRQVLTVSSVLLISLCLFGVVGVEFFVNVLSRRCVVAYPPATLLAAGGWLPGVPPAAADKLPRSAAVAAAAVAERLWDTADTRRWAINSRGRGDGWRFQPDGLNNSVTPIPTYVPPPIAEVGALNNAWRTPAQWVPLWVPSAYEMKENGTAFWWNRTPRAPASSFSPSAPALASATSPSDPSTPEAPVPVPVSVIIINPLIPPTAPVSGDPPPPPPVAVPNAWRHLAADWDSSWQVEPLTLSLVTSWGYDVGGVCPTEVVNSRFVGIGVAEQLEVAQHMLMDVGPGRPGAPVPSAPAAVQAASTTSRLVQGGAYVRALADVIGPGAGGYMCRDFASGVPWSSVHTCGGSSTATRGFGGIGATEADNEETDRSERGGVDDANPAWSCCRRPNIEFFGTTWLHFDSIGPALLLLFQVANVENWGSFMHAYMHGESPSLVAVFFGLVILVSQYLLVNAILGVFLAVFEEVTVEDVVVVGAANGAVLTGVGQQSTGAVTGLAVGMGGFGVGGSGVAGAVRFANDCGDGGGGAPGASGCESPSQRRMVEALRTGPGAGDDGGGYDGGVGGEGWLLSPTTAPENNWGGAGEGGIADGSVDSSVAAASRDTGGRRGSGTGGAAAAAAAAVTGGEIGDAILRDGKGSEGGGGPPPDDLAALGSLVAHIEKAAAMGAPVTPAVSRGRRKSTAGLTQIAGGGRMGEGGGMDLFGAEGGPSSDAPGGGMVLEAPTVGYVSPVGAGVGTGAGVAGAHVVASRQVSAHSLPMAAAAAAARGGAVSSRAGGASGDLGAFSMDSMAIEDDTISASMAGRQLSFFQRVTGQGIPRELEIAKFNERGGPWCAFGVSLLELWLILLIDVLPPLLSNPLRAMTGLAPVEDATVYPEGFDGSFDSAGVASNDGRRSGVQAAFARSRMSLGAGMYRGVLSRYGLKRGFALRARVALGRLMSTMWYQTVVLLYLLCDAAVNSYIGLDTPAEHIWYIHVFRRVSAIVFCVHIFTRSVAIPAPALGIFTLFGVFVAVGGVINAFAHPPGTIHGHSVPIAPFDFVPSLHTVWLLFLIPGFERAVMTVEAEAIVSVVFASALLVLVFAAVGMNGINGYLPRVDDPSRRNLYQFSSFHWSFLTLFQLLSGDDWSIPMYDAMHRAPITALVFFIGSFVVLNWFLLGLFSAVAVGEFRAFKVAYNTVMQERAALGYKLWTEHMVHYVRRLFAGVVDGPEPVQLSPRWVLYLNSWLAVARRQIKKRNRKTLTYWSTVPPGVRDVRLRQLSSPTVFHLYPEKSARLKWRRCNEDEDSEDEQSHQHHGHSTKVQYLLSGCHPTPSTRPVSPMLPDQPGFPNQPTGGVKVVGAGPNGPRLPGPFMAATKAANTLLATASASGEEAVAAAAAMTKRQQVQQQLLQQGGVNLGPRASVGSTPGSPTLGASLAGLGPLSSGGAGGSSAAGGTLEPSSPGAAARFRKALDGVRGGCPRRKQRLKLQQLQRDCAASILKCGKAKTSASGDPVSPKSPASDEALQQLSRLSQQIRQSAKSGDSTGAMAQLLQSQPGALSPAQSACDRDPVTGAASGASSPAASARVTSAFGSSQPQHFGSFSVDSGVPARGADPAAPVVGTKVGSIRPEVLAIAAAPDEATKVAAVRARLAKRAKESSAGLGRKIVGWMNGEPIHSDHPIFHTHSSWLVRWIRRRSSYSLFIFSPQNSLRVFCQSLMHNSWYLRTVLTAIIISTLMLALEPPSEADLAHPSRTAAWQNSSDVVFFVLFVAEALVQIVGSGFIWMPRGQAYLHNGWNVIDFGVLIAIGVGLNQPQLGMLRVLRVLRVVHRLQGLHDVFVAILLRRWQVAALLMAMVVVVFIFGVAGTGMWHGRLSSCSHPSFPVGGNLTHCSGLYADDNGVLRPATVDSVDLGFDSIGDSMLTLMIVSSGEGWAAPMFDTFYAANERGLAMLGHPHTVAAGTTFFVSFLALMLFLFANFFIDSILEGLDATRDVTVLEQIEAEKNHRELDPRTERRIETMKKKASVWRAVSRSLQLECPEMYIPAPGHWCGIRANLLPFVRSPWFESLIVVVMVTNLIVMMTKHRGMSSGEFYLVSLGADLIFVSLYLLETLMKLIALTPSSYFSDGWNKFDFVCTMLSVVGAGASLIDAGQGLDLASLIAALRVFRGIRLVRLLTYFESTNELLVALYCSIPDVLKVSIFWVLFVLTFNIIGLRTFGNVRFNENYQMFASFRTLSDATYMGMQLLTLDDWNSFMEACMTQGPQLCTRTAEQVLVDPNPRYQHWDDCGDPALALVFFGLYYVVGALILVQLVIAIVSDSFIFTLMERDDHRLPEVAQFNRTWAHCVASNTLSINRPQLRHLLRHLSAVAPRMSVHPNRRRGAYLALITELEYRAWLKERLGVAYYVAAGPLRVAMTSSFEESTPIDVPIIVGRVPRVGVSYEPIGKGAEASVNAAAFSAAQYSDLIPTDIQNGEAEQTAEAVAEVVAKEKLATTEVLRRSRKIIWSKSASLYNRALTWLDSSTVHEAAHPVDVWPPPRRRTFSYALVLETLVHRMSGYPVILNELHAPDLRRLLRRVTRLAAVNVIKGFARAHFQRVKIYEHLSVRAKLVLDKVRATIAKQKLRNLRDQWGKGDEDDGDDGGRGFGGAPLFVALPESTLEVPFVKLNAATLWPQDTSDGRVSRLPSPKGVTSDGLAPLRRLSPSPRLSTPTPSGSALGGGGPIVVAGAAAAEAMDRFAARLVRPSAAAADSSGVSAFIKREHSLRLLLVYMEAEERALLVDSIAPHLPSARFVSGVSSPLARSPVTTSAGSSAAALGGGARKPSPASRPPAHPPKEAVSYASQAAPLRSSIQSAAPLRAPAAVDPTYGGAAPPFGDVAVAGGDSGVAGGKARPIRRVQADAVLQQTAAELLDTPTAAGAGVGGGGVSATPAAAPAGGAGPVSSPQQERPAAFVDPLTRVRQPHSAAFFEAQHKKYERIVRALQEEADTRLQLQMAELSAWSALLTASLQSADAVAKIRRARAASRSPARGH